MIVAMALADDEVAAPTTAPDEVRPDGVRLRVYWPLELVKAQLTEEVHGVDS